MRQGMGSKCCTTMLLCLVVSVSSSHSSHLCSEGTLLQEVYTYMKLCVVPCSWTDVSGAVETIV